jgi:hypothetical protein
MRGGEVSVGEAVVLDACCKRTHQLPARLGDAFHAVDGLHVHGIADSRLRDPHGAEQVGPAPLRRLLEGAALVRTEHAADGAVRRHGALAAEPLALGNVGNAVAVWGRSANLSCAAK